MPPEPSQTVSALPHIPSVNAPFPVPTRSDVPTRSAPHLRCDFDRPTQRIEWRARNADVLRGLPSRGWLPHADCAAPPIDDARHSIGTATRSVFPEMCCTL